MRTSVQSAGAPQLVNSRGSVDGQHPKRRERTNLARQICTLFTSRFLRGVARILDWVSRKSIMWTFVEKGNICNDRRSLPKLAGGLGAL